MELIEEKDGEKEGHGGLNDFRRALAGVEENIDEKEASRRMLAAKALTPGASDEDKEASKKADKAGRSQDGKPEGPLDLSLIKTNPDALHPLIYRALKGVLKEWDQAMNDREGVLCF